MTSEMHQLANDPNFVVQFAIGDPMPDLVYQNRNSGIHLSGVYFNEPKRYILKKAHMSRDDNRMFDVETGSLVMVSHHLGKNPYESFDPLDLTNQDVQYNVNGGEWESTCEVSGSEAFSSLRIRPKSLSRHGRQYIKVNDETVMNIGKMSKFKSMSLRPHFVVCKGSGKNPVYTLQSDMIGRTVSITNEKDELVAQMAKTTKALIKNAVLGSGSESTIDIAPGVDCSVILAIIYGLGQVGKHYVKDSFNNFVIEPIMNSLIDTGVDAVVDTVGGAIDGMGEVMDSITDNIEDNMEEAMEGCSLQEQGEWIHDIFFGDE